MEENEPATSVLNIRPAIVLFLGEDAFASAEVYTRLIGKHTDFQRVLSVSAKADSTELRELLGDAFELFTAVTMKRLVDAGVLSDAQVNSVPVFVVVRGSIEQYASLVETIVNCASERSLADKLQFATITDVVRPEELRDKAACIHRSIEAITLPFVKLQTSVLAISDYWQGVRIGSEQQMSLALARITALHTLTQHTLEDGHLGFFRNVVFGGCIFWVGLGSYSAERLDLCASMIYADLLKETIGRTLSKNPQSIIGELRDETYCAILTSVANRIGRFATSEAEAETIATGYRTEIVPRILEAVCSRVKSPAELFIVLERLACRLRTKEPSSASASTAAVAPMSLLFVSPETGVAVAVIAIAAIGGIMWLSRRRKREAEVGEEIRTAIAHNQSSAPVPMPYDSVLADVLDDLRREMNAKLMPHRDEGNLQLLASASEGTLVGELRPGMKQMLESELARANGRAVIENTPHRLILLALESGKWRTPDACKELLVVQKEATKRIASTLRKEFIDWTLSAEQRRLTDKNFVQQVLYAPPPPLGAMVSQVCIAPADWALPELPFAVDRSYLPNCIHFMYLVEANVPN